MLYLVRMTATPSAGGTVPIWTMGDRLRKAREHAQLSAEQLALSIGISRNTVGNYEGEKVKQRKAVLIAWALCTGVSYEWLVDGVAPQPEPPVGFEPTTYRLVGKRPDLYLVQPAA